MGEDETMCERCGERKATIHLTDFTDGKPVQKHLCEQCYAEFGEVPLMSPTNVFAQLVAALAPELKELSNKACPECGINYLEFRQTMRLGCPHDYEVFGEPMEEMLGRIHGSAQHVGKVPAGLVGDSDRADLVDALRGELDQAVADENYERAAELRDRIRELQSDDTDGPEQ